MNKNKHRHKNIFHDWMSKRNLIVNDIVYNYGGKYILGVFIKTRLALKDFIAQYFLVVDYCNRCGGSLRDYKAPDELWRVAKKQALAEGLHINSFAEEHEEAGSYCFHCFIDLLEKQGIVYCPELTGLISIDSVEIESKLD